MVDRGREFYRQCIHTYNYTYINIFYFLNTPESSSPTSSDEEKFDQSYQYANKSDIPTSTAEESSSDAEAGNENRNSRWMGKWQRPQYETLDIFNIEPPFVVVTDGDSSSFNRSFGSDSDRMREI